MAQNSRRQVWERLIQTGKLEDEKISSSLAKMWRRSYEYKAEPYVPEPLILLSKEELAERCFKRREMLEGLEPVLANLSKSFSDNPFLVGVADDEGYLLKVMGDEESLKKGKLMSMVPGANHREEFIGNNPIGTSLHQEEPVYIQGGEHYCLAMKGWTTVGIPIHGPTGRIIGAVGLATPNRYANTNMFLTMVFAVQSMENRLVLKGSPEMKGIRDHFFRKSNLYITVVDKEGRIQNYNHDYSTLSGESREEILGRYFWDVWYGGEKYKENGQYRAAIIESLMTGRFIRGREISVKDKDGRSRWFLVDSLPLYDGEGKISGAMSILEDITEIKYLENQVYRSEKLATLGQLAASFAHEIRNPLTVIKGFLQMIETAGGDEAVQKHLPTIMEELERMDDLVSDFLLFAKPAAPEFKKVDLEELIEAVADFMQGEAARRDVCIVVKAAEEDFKVKVDPQQIRQVFINLVQNAIDASKSRSQITMRLDRHKKQNCVVVSVEDAGQGIAEDHISKVFDPFFTTKENGTGLGLFAAHRIIENHKGSVDVISREGKGTIMEVRLPTAAQ